MDIVHRGKITNDLLRGSCGPAAGLSYYHYLAIGVNRYFTVAHITRLRVLEVSELVPSPVSRIPEPLEPGHKPGNAHFKGPGEHFEIADADLLLAVFQIRNETAIHADVLGHVDLCPALPLAESA